MSLCIRLFQLLGRSCTSSINHMDVLWGRAVLPVNSIRFYVCMQRTYTRIIGLEGLYMVSIADASYCKNQPSPLLCLPSRFPFDLIGFMDVLCWSCPSSKCNQISCLNAEELRSYHRLGSAAHIVASSALLAHHTVKQPSPLVCCASKLCLWTACRLPR
jgi:hypothetical protein